MKTIGETKWVVGDRLEHKWYWHSQSDISVLEVARIEERGIVCDLLLQYDGVWKNKGHRFLYEWHEEGEKL